MRVRLSMLTLLAFALTLTATTAAGARTRPRLRSVSLLYVVNANHATLAPRHGRLALTLNGVEHSAVWFADRPVRRSGTLPSSALAADWAGLGFAKDPPNAAVDYTDPGHAGARTVILELGRPRYDAHHHTLSMPVRVLNPHVATHGDLADHARRADRSPPRTLVHPAVFIDDTLAPVLGVCVLEASLNCVGQPVADGNLSGLNLTGINLADTQLFNDNFNGANLTDAILTNAQVSNTTFAGTNLSGATLSYLQVDALNLSAARLTGANLYYANLTTANLAGAQLNQAQWIGGNADRANFTGANLAGANLDGFEALDANFTDANFTGANFFYTKLYGSTFCHTTMPNGSVNNSGCPAS